MSTNSEWVLGPHGPLQPHRYPILRRAALQALERQAASMLPAHTLMQHAGLALARLTLAYAPHARSFWVASGRGNNGGDGLEAALHLQQWGKTVHVSLPDATTPLPPDAAAALQRAQAAGVAIANTPPATWDACVDALVGIGLRAPPTGAVHAALHAMQTGQGPVIAADLPSGLEADTGNTPGACVRARATLSFLALKPGLLTGHGRDLCGDVWLNTLGVATATAPDAWLNTKSAVSARLHASHKGSFGDVAVVGGSSGMMGAALLAGTAALHGGAGRVYLALLESANPDAVFAACPTLMHSRIDQLALDRMAVVAGCGGGQAVAQHLPTLMARARQLVLDADALNALAQQPAWRSALTTRPPCSTVLTPHPLEAARLLGCSTAEVQTDRLACAETLAQRFQCTVVLKGSGTIIASPGEVTHINPTGNARVATAGTGDVLAGLLGSLMAQGLDGFAAAHQACYRHGQVADTWPAGPNLSAHLLAARI